MSLKVNDATTVSEYINSGKPHSGSALAVDSVGASTHTSNGLNYTDNRRLAISDEASVDRVVNGFPLASSGRIAVSANPVNHYANGIPFTISGQIAVNKVSGALLCSGVLSCSDILSCEG
jgi:hypothetical protein